MFLFFLFILMVIGLILMRSATRPKIRTFHIADWKKLLRQHYPSYFNQPHSRKVGVRFFKD